MRSICGVQATQYELDLQAICFATEDAAKGARFAESASRSSTGVSTTDKSMTIRASQKRLGLDYETLVALNARLVYLSLSVWRDGRMWTELQSGKFRIIPFTSLRARERVGARGTYQGKRVTSHHVSTRLAAETIASSEAATILVLMPTPKSLPPGYSTSTISDRSGVRTNGCSECSE